jgi:hypothetical protein
VDRRRLLAAIVAVAAAPGAGCVRRAPEPAKTPSAAAAALERFRAAGTIRMSFKAWFELLTWAGTAEVASNGAVRVACTENLGLDGADRSGWPATIEALIVDGRVYVKDSRLRLPAGRTWTVAEWGSKQQVPAPLFALLDPTLSLEDPAVDKNMRQEPFMRVGTGGRSPAPGQRALNATRYFNSRSEETERLRHWLTAAGDTTYLAFGLVIDADGTPARFSAGYHPPLRGPYDLEAVASAIRIEPSHHSSSFGAACAGAPDSTATATIPTAVSTAPSRCRIMMIPPLSEQVRRGVVRNPDVLVLDEPRVVLGLAVTGYAAPAGDAARDGTEPAPAPDRQRAHAGHLAVPDHEGLHVFEANKPVIRDLKERGGPLPPCSVRNLQSRRVQVKVPRPSRPRLDRAGGHVGGLGAWYPRCGSWS